MRQVAPWQKVVPLLEKGLGTDDIVAQTGIDRREVWQISQCWRAMLKPTAPTPGRPMVR
jgi:hypothetical protein